MKRCPECRRDYYDDSLLYCLDDGVQLLEGPGSLDEPATAILHEKAPPGEAATQAEMRAAEIAADPQPGDVSSKGIWPKKGLIVGLVIIVVIAITGFFGYRYTTQARQIESIAVMPFANEGGNPDVEYLSDGMTETLISSLSQLPNMNVRPRSSVFRYKGRETSPQTVSKELNVQAVLNGRIVQRGQDISVFVEIVDAAVDQVV